MSTAFGQPVILPFLVPSLPEPVVHNVFAQAVAAEPTASVSSSSTPGLQLKIFNLPPLSTASHIEHAFQSALDSDEPVVESVELHSSSGSSKKGGSVLQVEGVHASSSGSSKVAPLFVHPAGQAVAQQLSHPGSATLTFLSADFVTRVLKSWAPAATSHSDLPSWPTSQILSYADIFRLSHPELTLAQNHADQGMDRFEAGAEPEEPQVDLSKLSNRARKRLALEQGESMKAARKLAKREAKAAEADGGEWTVVTKGGRHEKPSQLLSTQMQQEEAGDADGFTRAASKTAGRSKGKRKGLMVDNMGNATEQGQKKKSKFMPADFYRTKKDDQKKKGKPTPSVTLILR